MGVGRGREVWFQTYMSGRVRGWYGLVVQVGDYLLVYFWLGSDVTSGSSRGYSVVLCLCRTKNLSLKMNINCITPACRRGSWFS